MNSIKDALIRLSRVVRQLENGIGSKPIQSYKAPKKKHSLVKPYTTIEIRRPDRNIPNVSRYSSLVRNDANERFKAFLRPLEIPNLKTLEEHLPDVRYDNEKARNNWLINKDNLSGFLYNRDSFSRMVNLIRDLLPEELTVNNKSPEYIKRILQVDQFERHQKSFDDIGPSTSFNRIPSMPSPLTPESFRKWIYQLTHVKYYYQNLSSLCNGKIADILLQTHDLNNAQYKRFRSVDTYNYLIKWFGYDKNQNSFARELILVMNKDGHRINLDTINQLLKICTTHLHIRQLSNTYDNISQNLILAKKLGLGLDLTSLYRIYDSVSSIYLKELYLNRLTGMGVPIPRGLIIRIVQDFAKTTKVTSELITFIENDLNILNWKEDSQIYNQVIMHRANYEPLDVVLQDVMHNYDGYTVKYLMESVVNRKGDDLQLWKIYQALPLDTDKYLRVVIIFKFLVQRTLVSSKYTQKQKIFLVRGIMHEMIKSVDMPLEVKVHVPSGYNSYEYYKMFKRVVGRNYKGDPGSITRLEACSRYYYGVNVLCRLLSEAEQRNWKLFFTDKVIIDDHIDDKGLVVAPKREGIVLDKYIARYEVEQWNKIQLNRVRDQLLMLRDANEEEEELVLAGIDL